MQSQFKEVKKSTIDEQIGFIRGARHLVAKPDSTVLFNEKNHQMLWEVEETLIAAKLIEYASQKPSRHTSMPYLKWVFLKANEHYFQALRLMRVIVDTENYTEYKHDDKQIYVRHSKEIKPDEICMIYIEPQVNMARTLRMQKTCIKIQLSIVPFHNRSRYSDPIASQMNTNSFIDFLNVCEDWEYKFWEMLMEEPELEFEKQSEPVEREPDMNGRTRMEEQEEMHRIQRDLK